jgi:Leucine-rich repeat (LRR) protein
MVLYESDLYSNPLKEIPPGTLSSKLQVLELSDTMLTEVPRDIAQMTNLSRLYVVHLDRRGFSPSYGFLMMPARTQVHPLQQVWRVPKRVTSLRGTGGVAHRELLPDSHPEHRQVHGEAGESASRLQ